MHLSNYHSHCSFCDGKGTPEEFLGEAIAQGLDAYGFSSHSPVPFKNSWSLLSEKVGDYMKAIQELKETHSDTIEVYCGMEVDYIPEKIGPQFPFIQELNLDYTIGSVHYIDHYEDGKPWCVDGSYKGFVKGLNEIYNGDVKTVVTRYFELLEEMVETSTPTIVGHMDRIRRQQGELFSEEEDWYRKALTSLLDTVAESGIYIEVNTKGIFSHKLPQPYPSLWVLKEIQKREIPLILGSDCHHPTEIVAEFDKALELAQEAGFKEVYMLLEGEWQPIGLDRVRRSGLTANKHEITPNT